MKYDKQGRELPDDTPVEIPVRFRHHQPTQADELVALIERLNRDQREEGDDMDMVDEDQLDLGDLPSQYELDHDAEERTVLYQAHRQDKPFLAKQEGAAGGGTPPADPAQPDSGSEAQAKKSDAPKGASV